MKDCVQQRPRGKPQKFFQWDPDITFRKIIWNLSHRQITWTHAYNNEINRKQIIINYPRFFKDQLRMFFVFRGNSLLRYLQKWEYNGVDGWIHLSKFDSVSAISPVSTASPSQQEARMSTALALSYPRKTVLSVGHREQERSRWEQHLQPREESQWESRPWLGFAGQRGWAPAQGNLATFLFSFLFPSCISLAQPTCSNSALSSTTYRHSSTSDCFCSIKTGWKMWKFTLPQDRKVKELQKK